LGGAVAEAATKAAGTTGGLDVYSGATATSNAWLAVAADGSVTIFSGKVELGTGVQTALSQIVAEELYVDLPQVRFVQGDTSQTPNQGYTAGSQTIQGGAIPLRQAAATALQSLLTLASTQLGVPASQLVARDGQIGVGKQLRQAVSYGQLIGGQQIQLPLNTAVPLKDPSAYQIVGQSVPRADLPDKFLAQFTYIQDLVIPNMLHGRVVRPSGRNATLLSVDPSSVLNIPGVVKVVQQGNFVGVVATDEWAAIQAAKNLDS